MQQQQTNDHIAMLQVTGFRLHAKPPALPWDRHLQELKQYKATHGLAVFPEKSVTKLGLRPMQLFH